MTPSGTCAPSGATSTSRHSTTTPQAEIDQIAAQLTHLARECELCRVDGEGLALHFLNGKQEEWERSLPAWRCGCGAPYKIITGEPAGEGGRDELYQLEDPPRGPLCARAAEPADDADCAHESCGDILNPPCVLGDLAGVVVRAKGKIKRNDKCPACGARFAGTLADQYAAQQPLFPPSRTRP
jgi:hypothetical protein